jgi:hypothetical protein
MISTSIQDSLKVAQETVVQNSSAIETGTNWWFWIAIAEFGLIIILILFRRKYTGSHSRREFKKESINQDIDFNNIINSSFNSEALYDVLKAKCHPDRFPTDLEKNAIAENLFQEISISKTNVNRLLELKQEAEKKLSINF